MSPAAWRVTNVALFLPRVALMVATFWLLTEAQYYDGGNTVLSLTPKVALNQLAYDFNALAVWLVSVLVVAASVWYLPRLLLALGTSLLFIPWTLRGRTAQAAEAVYPRWPFGLSAATAALVGFVVASYAPLPGENIGPLEPVLRSNFWLTIHVLTIVSSYAAGALAWMLGNIALAYYAFGRYRVPTRTAHADGYGPAGGADDQLAYPRPPEETVTLASYAYKAVQVAVLLLAAGTMLGGLWADVSWGRFWGWDPKEVFALVSLLIYLAILHGRYAGLFGNFGLAVGTVLGASAIIFSWYGVNFVLGVGLHSYGFGTGGQLEVLSAVVANWLFVAFAAWRYWTATQPVPVSSQAPRERASRKAEEPVASK
jgi:ABC-type transport system involved in cytochrome c biogenesis permease subunit